jgi:hypothetical protein
MWNGLSLSDRVGGNDLNAKHRNQKRAANGRTYHTEDRVRHQSSSLVAERGDTTEHDPTRRNLDVRFGPRRRHAAAPARASSSTNNANDGSTHLLKVSNLIQARRCDCAQSWVSMKPPRPLIRPRSELRLLIVLPENHIRA